MLRKFILYFFVILVGTTIYTTAVNAQVPVSPRLEISASTNSPAPGQTVTLTVRSYNEDLDSATIIWSVDGKEVRREVGGTTINTKAPALGKQSNVTVTAIIPGGGQISGTFSLSSGSIDLIIESDGYVPPFFPGKIAPSFQNNVKIIAVPHLANAAGVEYDPKSLVYEWQRNNMAIEGQSGFGKRSVTIEGSIVPRPYNISVTIRSRDGSASATGFITVDLQSPTLAFYVDDPLYGPLFNKSVGNQLNLGKERESSVIAIPFGFNKSQNGAGNLSFEWTVNNVPRPDLISNQTIVLRGPEDSAGTSRIGLTVKNNLDILQGAIGGFIVSFLASTNEESSLTF